jgi:hypothetical protein
VEGKPVSDYTFLKEEEEEKVPDLIGGYPHRDELSLLIWLENIHSM